jgi:hypothetical protein
MYLKVSGTKQRRGPVEMWWWLHTTSDDVSAERNKL